MFTHKKKKKEPEAQTVTDISPWRRITKKNLALKYLNKENNHLLTLRLTKDDLFTISYSLPFPSHNGKKLRCKDTNMNVLLNFIECCNEDFRTNLDILKPELIDFITKARDFIDDKKPKSTVHYPCKY